MEDLAIFGRLIAFIAFPIGLLFLLFNPLIGFLIIIASIAVWNICGHCLKKEGTLETQNTKASKVDSHSKQLNENLKEAPQKTQFEITSSKLSNTIHNKPQLIWMVTCMILMLLFAGSLSDKVSKKDYEALQDDYETLQEEYSSLQTEYDESVSNFKSTRTKLDDTLSAYEAYQERMQPFDSLTDDELNIVASKITQTLEEKQAEETAKAQAQAEAQATQQPAQESMVWIPQSGSKYHSNSSCSNMKNPSQVSISQAQASGYEPCKKCY